MEFIKKLFTQKQTTNAFSESIHSTHENAIIDMIIDLLESKPKLFSALGNNDYMLSNVVRSKDGQIVINIENGQIVSPINPIMTQEQYVKVKRMIEPIVKKDSEYLLQKFKKDFQ